MKPSKSNNSNNNSNNHEGNSSSSSSRRYRTSQAAADTLDMPNFSDDQSIDSLDFFSKHLKDNLNASLRDASGESGLGGGIMGGEAAMMYEGGQSSGQSVASSSRTGSDGSRTGGTSHGPNGAASGGRGNRRSIRHGISSRKNKTSSLQEADHVDMPHLDDILRASTGSNSSADAAGGGLRSSRMDRSVDSARSGRSGRGGGSIGSSTNGSANNGGRHGGGRGARRAGGVDNNRAHSAIIIEDEESASDGSSSPISRAGLRDTLSNRKPFKSSPTRDPSQGSNRSLNSNDLQMPTLGKSDQNRRNSWMFESLWSSSKDVQHLQNIDEATNASVDAESRFSGYDNNGSQDGSEESLPVRLFRTVSGRAAIMRSNSGVMPGMPHNPNGGPPPPHSYYGRGGNCVNSIQEFVRSHAKLTAMCIFISMGMAATIGALVVMIPLWLDAEERGESAQLGGLAYEGNKGESSGVIMGDSSSGGGGVMVEEASNKAVHNDSVVMEQMSKPSPIGGNEESGANDGAMDVDNGSAPPAQSSSVSPPTVPQGYKLKPPPYNLRPLCSPSATSLPGGYEKCISACLPSQCCLVAENKPYEVWKIVGNNNPGGSSSTLQTNSFKNRHAYTQQLGSTIHSCFHDFPDMCVHYYNQCSSIGTSVLLPRKPPAREEVNDMSDGEKLELAEWVNHSCGKMRTTGDDSDGGDGECAALCREKECCFSRDDEEEKEEEEEEATMDPTSNNGADSPGMQDALIANGFVEVISVPGDEHMLVNNSTAKNAASSIYDGDAPASDGSEPTALPSTNASNNMGMLTDKPTPAESTGFGERRLSRPQSRQMLQLHQMQLEHAGQTQTQQIQTQQEQQQTPPQQPGLRRRTRRLDTDPQLAHMEIPGEEDFVYVVEGSKDANAMGDAGHYGMESSETNAESLPEGAFASYPGDGTVGLTVEEPLAGEDIMDEPILVPKFEDEGEEEDNENIDNSNKSCVNDPQQHCMTYVGCAPLFGK